jgi:SAM-dependent methyltransferase
MTWNHGYHSSLSYTSAFYRELSPSWLDYAGLLKGHLPPRSTEEDSFVYLDLGCGTGLGLVMLAALYPEGHFYGVDFQPDHVAHAQDLIRRVGLLNVQVIEADFLALASTSSPQSWPEGGCDYVVAHGIATWVTEPIQAALLAVAASALRPGGLFYCSYNTYPGWLARSNFQALLALELPTARQGELAQCFQQTAQQLNQLLGDEAQPTPFGANHPGLRRDLQAIHYAPIDYLCGEYANDGWAPLYVHQLHARCQVHKLAFLGSATLSEAFPELLPSSLRELVIRDPRPGARELLVDLATHKSFRRDLFTRGHVSLTQQEWSERMACVAFRLLLPLQEWLPVPTEPLHFRASFGDIQGDPVAYGPLIEAIAAVPTSVQTLLNADAQSQSELMVMLSLLLEAGCIGFDRGDGMLRATPAAQRLNQLLLDRMQEGRQYSQLALPAVGAALPVTVVEALIHRAHLQQLEEPMLSGCVQLWLSDLAVQLLGDDQAVITDAQASLARIQAIASAFIGSKHPALLRLGAIADRSAHPSRSTSRKRQASSRGKFTPPSTPQG